MTSPSELMKRWHVDTMVTFVPNPPKWVPLERSDSWYFEVAFMFPMRGHVATWAIKHKPENYVAVTFIEPDEAFQQMAGRLNSFFDSVTLYPTDTEQFLSFCADRDLDESKLQTWRYYNKVKAEVRRLSELLPSDKFIEFTSVGVTFDPESD